MGREWLARGLLPARGTPQWYPSGLRYVLTSPALYGATVHRGKVLREDDGSVRIDPEQAILTYAEHLELVGLLDARAVHRPDPSTEPALLDRLLRCASCGRVMYAHRPTTGVAGYRCRGTGCPAPVSIAAHLAEPPIVSAFLEIFGPLEVLTAEGAETRPDPDEVARLREALEAVAEALSGSVDDEEGLALLRRRRDLRARLAAVQDEAARRPRPVALAPTGRTYAEEWEAAEAVRDRNRLLRGAWQCVEVAPGRRGGPSIAGEDRLTFVD